MRKLYYVTEMNTTYGLFGNRGEYRMPHTPEFNSAEEARAYFRHWWPGGNRYIVVLPLNR